VSENTFIKATSRFSYFDKNFSNIYPFVCSDFYCTKSLHNNQKIFVFRASLKFIFVLAIHRKYFYFVYIE